MKLQLDPKSTREAVGFVAGVVGRSSLPILNHIRMSANGETQFIGTDLDVSLIARLPVEGALDLCLPSKTLIATIKPAKTTVAFDVDDKGRCLLTADSFTSTVPTLSAEDYPPLTRVPDKVSTITVKAAEFIRALSQVEPAQSTDHTRYVMNGVCLQLDRDKEKVLLIATDGRRLHVASIEGAADYTKAPAAKLKKAQTQLDKVRAALPGIQSKFPDIADPNKHGKKKPSPQVEGATSAVTAAQLVVDELERGPQLLLTSETVRHILRLPNRKHLDTITIESWHADECGWSRLTAGTFTIIAKQISGTYPHWRQVVPSDFKEEFVVGADEFAAALTHADTATSEASNSVKLTLTRHTLNVRGYSADKGEAKSDIAINYAGKDMSIAFNPLYLLELCAACKGEPIKVKLTDELCPGVFEQGGTVAVVMPMRLS